MAEGFDPNFRSQDMSCHHQPDNNPEDSIKGPAVKVQKLCSGSEITHNSATEEDEIELGEKSGILDEKEKSNQIHMMCTGSTPGMTFSFILMQ